MKIVLLLLSLCLASVALAEEPAELERLRQQWEEQRTEAQEEIDKLYFDELEQLKKNFVQLGNIADARAVNKAIKGEVKADNEPDALVELSEARSKSLKKALKPLDKQYWQDLKKLRRGYQKQGSLAGIEATDAEIEKVLVAYKKNAPASILKYSYEPKESYRGKGSFDYTDRSLEILTDPETRDKILEKAIESSELEERGNEGEELWHAKNKQTPYTGWSKDLYDTGQVEALSLYKDGKAHGHYTGWYENGQKSMEGNYKDGKLMSDMSWKPDGTKCPLTNIKDGNGVFVAYHMNGQKKEAVNFKDGKKHGLVTGWDEEGQKKEEGGFHEGKRHGVYTSWHENGQKKQVSEWEEDNQHGLITEWYETGQKKSEGSFNDGKQHGIATFWHMNGQKKETVNFKDGKKHGLVTKWGEEGQKREEGSFHEGKQHGVFTDWYENGQKKQVSNWKEDNPHGLITDWYETGQKKSEGSFNDGKQHGIATFWYENGQKRMECTFKDDKPHGLSTTWDEEGKVTSQTMFENGEKVE